MTHDNPPLDDEILQAIGAYGIEPDDLVKALRETHEIGNVIEGLQRALERGKIAFDSEGMVVAAHQLATAA